jgi:hypothetical protein
MSERYYPAIDSENVIACIYDREKVDVRATLEARATDPRAAEINKIVTYIRIKVKGQTDEYDQPLKPEDKERFPLAWSAYLGEDVAFKERGIPLSDLPSLQNAPDLIHKMVRHGINKVEDIAAASDAIIQQFGTQPFKLRKEARELVERKGQEDYDGLFQENEKLKEQVASQTAMLEEFAARLGKLEDKKKGKTSS